MCFYINIQTDFYHFENVSFFNDFFFLNSSNIYKFNKINFKFEKVNINFGFFSEKDHPFLLYYINYLELY